MERTSLVTKYELDIEVTTRVQRDSWLAQYTGQPWEPSGVPSDVPPDYSTLIDIQEGQSLREAVDTLDSAKNRRISIQNSIGGVVVDNPKFIKFSGFSLTSLDGGNGLMVAISSDVVYKPGTEESLAFGFGNYFGQKFFTGNRFAYGMSVNYSVFSSIKSAYAAISNIVLHGCQARVAPAGSEGGGEMRAGTVVRDFGSIYSAAAAHPPTSLNRPSSNPRPVEWRGEGRLDSGSCLKYWTAGENYNRGDLVMAGNTFYAVLKSIRGAGSYPPNDPDSYYPISFQNYATRTTYLRGDKVTDIDGRGAMRTLRMAKEQYNTANESIVVLSKGADVIWHDVTENMTWASMPRSHVFTRGDIVKYDSSSPTLYICLTGSVQKDAIGGNPTSSSTFQSNFLLNTTSQTIALFGRYPSLQFGAVFSTVGSNSLTVGDMVTVSPTTGLALPSGLTPGTYYVIFSVGNIFQLSTSLGGEPVNTSTTSTSIGGKVTAERFWEPLVGLVPWHKGRTTDPGAFYCWGMGKIVCSRRRGYVDNSAPSLDSGGSSWWFVNDNYKLNPANQRTNASNLLEWPAVGSSIVVTG